jgi:hypothetical protein
MTFTEEATREKNATSSLSAGVTNIASAPSAADSSSSGVKRAHFFLRRSSKFCLSRVSTPPKFLLGPQHQSRRIEKSRPATAREIAKILNLHPVTVYRKAKAHVILCRFIGTAVRFDLGVMAQWWEELHS